MHSESPNFSAILFSRVTNAMPLAGLREFCRTPQAPGAPGAFYSTQRTSAVGPPCCRGPEPISLLLTRAAEVGPEVDRGTEARLEVVLTA
jgi:hypothetical protein